MANNIRILITADDKASKPIRQLSGELDNTTKSGSRFASVMKGAGKVAFGAVATGAAAVTTGLTLAAKASYDQVKAVEEARFGLMAYEKDGRKVEKVLAGLVEYAQSDMGVLFNRKDMFAAASTLKMYGNATETLDERVKILSKGVAQGKTTFQELSAIVGRAAAKGRLDAVDFDMLIERGIGLDREFRGAKVSAEELWKALDKALPDKLLEGRANTIEGRMIRLQSAFRMVGNEVLGVDAETNNFIEGGLGDRFQKAIVDATGFLRDIAPVIGDVVTGFLDFTDAVRDGFVKALELGRDALDWIGDRINDVSGFIRDAKDNLIAFKDDAVEKVNDVIKGSKKVWDDFTNWIEENEGAIKGVSTTLTIIFGPALVRAGTLAVIEGAKIAGAGIAAGGGWVAGAVSAGVAWAVNTARMGALSAGVYALMVKDAIKSGFVWAKNAVVASAAWVLNMAKISLSMIGTSIVATVRAADAGWAWVLNATRASFAWVTQELPRIVKAFVVTAVASTVEAAKSSAAWIANAARASFAWVVTELPKIVTGFIVTSGAATIEALKASAAWVASASKSAVAWVVTQLPRIIAAFAATSAAAVAHAAVAAGAWVASATKSSLAIKSLAALVATPMVMPAIVVAAALASLGLVLNKAKEVHRAINDAMAASDAEREASLRIMAGARERYDRGEITEKQFRALVGNAARAQGTNYAPGGLTLVGERGPELVNLPRGSQVMQAYRTRQALSDGVSGGDTNININGTINIHTPEAADAFWNRVDKTQRLAKVGMA